MKTRAITAFEVVGSISMPAGALIESAIIATAAAPVLPTKGIQAASTPSTCKTAQSDPSMPMRQGLEGRR